MKGVAALLGAGVAVILWGYGAGEAGVREVVRWTARSSLCLLCLALVADGLRGDFFGWRRFAEVLRSLALSHTVHAVAVGALALQLGGRNLLERSAPLDVLGAARSPTRSSSLQRCGPGHASPLPDCSGSGVCSW